MYIWYSSYFVIVVRFLLLCLILPLDLCLHRAFRFAQQKKKKTKYYLPLLSLPILMHVLVLLVSPFSRCASETVTVLCMYSWVCVCVCVSMCACLLCESNSWSLWECSQRLIVILSLLLAPSSGRNIQGTDNSYTSLMEVCTHVRELFAMRNSSTLRWRAPKRLP